MTIVELVKSLNTMQTETILHLVKEVVKKPHQIKGEQVRQCLHRTDEPYHVTTAYRYSRNGRTVFFGDNIESETAAQAFPIFFF